MRTDDSTVDTRLPPLDVTGSRRVLICARAVGGGWTCYLLVEDTLTGHGVNRSELIIRAESNGDGLLVADTKGNRIGRRGGQAAISQLAGGWGDTLDGIDKELRGLDRGALRAAESHAKRLTALPRPIGRGRSPSVPFACGR